MYDGLEVKKGKPVPKKAPKEVDDEVNFKKVLKEFADARK